MKAAASWTRKNNNGWVKTRVGTFTTFFLAQVDLGVKYDQKQHLSLAFCSEIDQFFAPEGLSFQY